MTFFYYVLAILLDLSYAVFYALFYINCHLSPSCITCLQSTSCIIHPIATKLGGQLQDNLEYLQCKGHYHRSSTSPSTTIFVDDLAPPSNPQLRTSTAGERLLGLAPKFYRRCPTTSTTSVSNFNKIR